VARLSCDRICSLLLLVFAQTAFASALVRQVSVSPQKLRQGDSMTLEVAVKDLAATLKWIHEGKVICDGSSCNINSEKWGLGTHKLYLILAKRPKQEILSFTIFVGRAKFGIAPKLIIPKQTSKFRFESISETSKVVQAVKGSGFISYGRRKQIIDRIPRIMRFPAQIRTTESGVVRILIPGKLEAFVLENSEVELKIHNSQLVPIVRKGTLRIRSLSEGKTNWFVLVNDWLQVSPDAASDVVIKSDDLSEPARASVIVLRGIPKIFYLRIVSKTIERKEIDQAFGYAGANFDFVRGSQMITEEFPAPQEIGRVLLKTTPHYLSFSRFEAAIGDVSQGGGRAVGEKLSIRPAFIAESALSLDFEPAAKQANVAAYERDYLAALEYILAHRKMINESYESNIALARSYGGLYNLKKAEKFYLKTIKIKSDNYAAHRELAELYFMQRKWAKAHLFFEKAAMRGEKDRQLLRYYIGVCEFFMGQVSYARNSFLKADAIDLKNKKIRDEIQVFLDYIFDNKKLILKVNVSSFYDTNIMRRGESDIAIPLIPLTQAFGYDVDLEMEYRGFNNDFGSFSIIGTLNSRNYADEQLSRVSRRDYVLAADAWVSIRPWDGEGFASFRIQPKWMKRGYGNGISASVYSVLTYLRADGLPWSPFFEYIPMRWDDSDPDRYDVLDPELETFSFAIDRSKFVRLIRLGMQPYDDGKTKVGMSFLRRTADHQGEVAKAENYIHTGGQIEVEYKFLSMLQLSGKIEYSAIDYDDYPTELVQSRLNLESVLRYYISYSFLAEGSVTYEDNTADVSEYSYDKILVKGMLSLQL
jgi:tetratricopeptide (TPR) repeat protein